MPRIPEGNFRTDPSTRVPSASVPSIDTSGAEKLSKLGAGFLGIAKQLETAQNRAESYKKADEAAEDFNTTYKKEVDKIMMASSGGEYEDSLTKKKVKVGDAVKNLSRKWLQKKYSELGNDPEALTQFQNIERKVAQYEANAERLQAQQIESSHIQSRNSALNQLQADSIDEYDFNPDVEVNSYRVDNSKRIGIINQEAIDKMNIQAGDRIAMGATEYIDKWGIAPQTIKNAKKRIAQHSDPGIKQALNRKLDNKIKGIQQTKIDQSSRNVKFIRKNVNSYRSFIENQPLVNATVNDLINLPLGQYQTQAQRDEDISSLYGHLLAWQATAAAGPVSAEEAKAINFSQGGVASPQAYKAYINNRANIKIQENMSKAVRKLASAPFFKNKSKEEKERFIKGMVSNYAQKRREIETSTSENFRDMYIQESRELPRHQAEGNPDGIEEHMNLMIDSANNHGITDVNIVSKEAKKDIGKQFLDMKKGRSDTKGNQFLHIVESTQRSHKGSTTDFSHRAIDEIITGGGGTQSGKPNVYPAFSTAALIENKDFIRDMGADINNYQRNLADVLTLNVDGKVLGEGFTSVKQIDNVLKQTAVEEFNGLKALNRHGNHNLYRGFVQGISSLSAKIMKEDALSPSQATKRAIEIYNNHIEIAKSGDHSVIISGDLVRSRAPEVMSNTITDISELKYFDELNYNIDYNSMARVYAKRNPEIAKQFSLIAAVVGKDPQDTRRKQNAQFIARFKESLQVINHPHNANVAQLFVGDTPLLNKTTKGNFVEVEDGKPKTMGLEPVVVEMEDYMNYREQQRAHDATSEKLLGKAIMTERRKRDFPRGVVWTGETPPSDVPLHEMTDKELLNKLYADQKIMGKDVSEEIKADRELFKRNIESEKTDSRYFWEWIKGE